MTASCGLVGTATQLFYARTGVGIGEATLSPCAYSLLGDQFSAETLPRALSVYTLGLFIGSGLALVLGGSLVTLVAHQPPVTLPVIGAVRAWQLVFLLAAMPGAVLAVWMATLREPARRSPGDAAAPASGGLAAFIRDNKLVATALFIGSALLAEISYEDVWYPELFIRTWHWSAAQAGLVNGVASLTTGPLGLLAAGWWSSRILSSGRNDAPLRLSVIAAAAMTITATALPLSPAPLLAACALFVLKFFMAFAPVLVPAAIQTVAPEGLRGQLAALFIVTTGILGVAGGPTVPGLLADHVFQAPGGLALALSTSALVLARYPWSP